MTANIPKERPKAGLRGLRTPSPSPSRSLTDYSWMSDHEYPSSEEEVAFKFFTGVLLWVDIISCISLGTSPGLLHLHDPFLHSDGMNIQLQDIMGCENWAMVQIGRVAELQAWKTQAKLDGKLSLMDLVQRADPIKKGLESGLTTNLEATVQSDIEFEALTEAHSGKSTIHITRVFAFAAMTYLHVTVSGAQPDLREIKTSVSEAIKAIKLIVGMNADWLRSLIWPIFVTGCMAAKEDEVFFRNLLSVPALIDPLLKHHSQIMRLFEEFWSMRERPYKHCTWENSFHRLDCSFLLV